MRAVVTRVSEASVVVDGQLVGAIGSGLLALVGAGRDDDADRARALARKVHELRVFRPGTAHAPWATSACRCWW